MPKYLISLLLLSGIIVAELPSIYKTNPYATHQPILYEIAMKTTGPIIEFGCGDGSTDLLHDICRKNKRILISIDNDLNWLDRYKEKYLGDGYELDNSGWHKIIFVPGKIDNSNPQHWIDFLENCELIRQYNYDLCFIDQSPGMARTETIIRFANIAKYIILHDCDMYVGKDFEEFKPGVQAIGREIKPLDSVRSIPGLYDFSKMFQHFRVYFPAKPWPGQSGPPTLLVSNFDSNFPNG